MKQISIDQITENSSFSGDLFLDNTFLLLPESAEASKEFIEALKLWDVSTVLCSNSNTENQKVKEEVSEKIDLEEPEEPQERMGDSVKKALQGSFQTRDSRSDKTRMEMVSKVFDEYMNYIENLFTHYATHKEIDKQDLSDTVQSLCVFIRDNRRYVLRINPTTQNCKKNFLVIHTMRSTVLAIAIALQLHIPLSRMVDLGITSILHEIGMLRVPPQLYMSNKILSPNQKAQITKHTILGYTIIKDLEFPLSVQLGVLEHHEKENGTGYPRKLTGDKISSTAKIISVACSYEAISSARQYKQERSTYDAMLEILQNKDKAYDESVIKALLYTVSLYPIGTYVYLSNRKVAEVIDTNPNEPKNPIVQILTEKEADGSYKTLQTNSEISILRILSKKEKDDFLEAISNQENNITPKTETPLPPVQEEKTEQESSEMEEIDINQFN